MKNDNVVAIDLAKNTFQVCVINNKLRVLKNKKRSRSKLLNFVLNQPANQIVMESCYSANYWGRVFQSHGLEVKLIPPQHVKPFVRGNKNDKNDALAIAEASRRPHIRFVPVKSIEQQDMQALHRIRERLLANRVRLTNQVRGLLSEYGIVMAKGNHAFKTKLLELIEQDSGLFGPLMRQELRFLLADFNRYQQRITHINQQIRAAADRGESQPYLMTLPGIGPIISSAVVSAIGNGQPFHRATEFAVWLGLTPGQHSSGDQSISLSITKRGNQYLRKQLVHGARAALLWCRSRHNRLADWANALITRRGFNKACVAMAHKLARIAWAILRDQKPFNVEHVR